MARAEEFIATGRRKTSVARIRMPPGSGKIDINGRHVESGRFAAPRSANERAKKIRPARRAKTLPVLEALILLRLLPARCRRRFRESNRWPCQQRWRRWLSTGARFCRDLSRRRCNSWFKRTHLLHGLSSPHAVAIVR